MWAQLRWNVDTCSGQFGREPSAHRSHGSPEPDHSSAGALSFSNGCYMLTPKFTKLITFFTHEQWVVGSFLFSDCLNVGVSEWLHIKELYASTEHILGHVCLPDWQIYQLVTFRQYLVFIPPQLHPLPFTIFRFSVSKRWCSAVNQNLSTLTLLCLWCLHRCYVYFRLQLPSVLLGMLFYNMPIHSLLGLDRLRT